MKTKISVLVILFSLMMTSGFSQEKSRSEIKKERKLEKQSQIAEMVNAREFVFIGRTAQPQGYRSVNLASNPNFVKFHPDLIEGYMPYFGKAYSGVGYGGDGGLKFDGVPEDYTVEKRKKNFLIEAVVKGENDVYDISLTVGFEGSSTLSIISNNRSPISYIGDISAPEKPKE
jgi:hypothetical protein